MSDAPRKLDVVRGSDAPGPQVRHPDDGWTLAEPLAVSARTERVIYAITDAILPPKPRTETVLDDVVRTFLVLLSYMPTASRISFMLALRVLNLAPLWRLRGVRPLTRLTRDRAQSILEGIAESRFLPVRLLMLGPQALLLSAYFDNDSIHPYLDYDPMPFARDRIALRQRLLRGEEPDAKDQIEFPAQAHP